MNRFDIALEVKALDAEKGVFEGYGSTFSNRDLQGDVIEAGAFAASIKSRGAKGVKMLADHDRTKRVGVWEQIEEDDHGLKVRGRLLLEKEVGRDAYVDLKNGALDALSIGFRLSGEAKYDGRRKARIIKQADLIEISLVTFPANEQARVTGVKSDAPARSLRDFEAFLRDVGGYSHAAAKSIAAGGYKASEPRDEDDADDLAELIRRNINILKGKK